MNCDFHDTIVVLDEYPIKKWKYTGCTIDKIDGVKVAVKSYFKIIIEKQRCLKCGNIHLVEVETNGLRYPDKYNEYTWPEDLREIAWKSK